MINPDFMYIKHRHLMTREELEEENHIDTPKEMPTHSPKLRRWILDGNIDGEEDADNDALPPIQLQQQKLINTLHHFGGCVDSNGMRLYDHRQLQNIVNSLRIDRRRLVQLLNC